MKFTVSIFAILATSALASAVAPAAERGTSANPRRDTIWGQCNGTSCRINGDNYGCTKGSCTSQSGAGDGTPCSKLGGSICCPGNRNGQGCP
ncbi:hypothetical protein PG995_007777 [Apiospora arundinis]